MTRLSIRRSRQAQADQNDIWLIIAEDNSRAADSVIEKLNSAIFMLADQPGAGRERTELGTGLRSFPVGSYVIFYTISPGVLGIRRIMHGARNITAELFSN